MARGLVSLRGLVFLMLLTACLALLAPASQRHAWQWDVTAQGRHSLSISAKQALDGLEQPLEFIAFVPDYPVQRAQLRHLLAAYLAHPAQPRLRFVDPIAEPSLARDLGVRRHGELHLRSATRRQVVAAPTAATIDAALNRLALRGERWIVAFRGNGERPLDSSPSGLARLVERLETLGYRFVALDSHHIEELPDNAALLLLAGPTQAYPEAVQAQIRRFLARGGSLLWAFDDALPDWLANELGIASLPGIVVDAAAARYGLDDPDNAIVSDYPATLFPTPPGQHAVLKQARAVELIQSTAQSERWQAIASLQSSPRSWNETGNLRGRIARDPERGERLGPLTLALALQGREQAKGARIVLMGSSDAIANSQLGMADNAALLIGLVNWLTANQGLTTPLVASDQDLDWPPALAGALAMLFMIVLPITYLATGWWLRSRRRRA